MERGAIERESWADDYRKGVNRNCCAKAQHVKTHHCIRELKGNTRLTRPPQIFLSFISTHFTLFAHIHKSVSVLYSTNVPSSVR